MQIIHTTHGGMHLRMRKTPNPKGFIVCVHGLGESGLCFEGLMQRPELADWTILAPDLPGYGKNPWPTTARTIPQHTEAVLRLTANDGLENAVFLGHSMGGVIGTLAFEARPGLFSAFVNVEGNISPADCTGSKAVSGYTPEAFADGGFLEFWEENWKLGCTDPAFKAYCPSLRLAHPPTLYANSLELVEASAREDLAARMGAIDAPAVYILGDPRGTGERSRTLLDEAGVEWRAVADAGHWPFIDQPDAFTAELARFLDALST